MNGKSVLMLIRIGLNGVHEPTNSNQHKIRPDHSHIRAFCTIPLPKPFVILTSGASSSIVPDSVSSMHDNCKSSQRYAQMFTLFILGWCFICRRILELIGLDDYFYDSIKERHVCVFSSWSRLSSVLGAEGFFSLVKLLLLVSSLSLGLLMDCGVERLQAWRFLRAPLFAIKPQKSKPQPKMPQSWSVR